MKQCRMGFRKSMRTAKARLIILDRRMQRADGRIRLVSKREIPEARREIARQLRMLGDRGREKLDASGGFEKEANVAVERHISATVRKCRDESERLKGMMKKDAGMEMAAWAAGIVGGLFSFSLLLNAKFVENLPATIQALPHAGGMAAAGVALLSLGIFALLRRRIKKSCRKVIALAERASSRLKAGIGETATIIAVEKEAAIRKLKGGSANGAVEGAAGEAG